ncbi:MAG: RloB domain-containing protein [Proteobacteria bacterium]|nr:RloB domain-containing protein [Pseudomonadota bacterium]MBS0493470.1 RloB domain-containing protein [Pseudomonadota bacterium]
MGSDDLFHKRKARSNAALQRQQKQRAQNIRYLIVCEGAKTEPYYFQGLLDDRGIRPTSVRIASNQGASPDRVVEHALRLYEEDAHLGDPYDAVYCVFDRDKHTTFDASVQRTKDCSAHGKPLIAITSTPCFEVWLLLHFGYWDQPFHAAGKKSVGDQVVTQLRKKAGMAQYGKGQKDVYAQLKNRLDSALTQAERLRQHGQASASINPATEVDQLVRVLLTLGR